MTKKSLPQARKEQKAAKARETPEIHQKRPATTRAKAKKEAPEGSGIAKNSKKKPPPKSKATRKNGRPTAYKPEYCDEIMAFFEREPFTEHERTITRKDGSTVTEMYRLAAELPTLASFACHLKVHRDTLNEWSRIHPEFSDAIKRAKDNQERILVTNGLCGLYEGPFAIFTAKNVAGWRDKTVHSNDPENPMPGLIIVPAKNGE